jgi:hypothetical protein
MTNSKREALLAQVAAHLLKATGITEAHEYPTAEPQFGFMEGKRIAKVKFTASGVETLPAAPVRMYEPKAEFAIDEANDRAFVSYENIRFLSGWGASWIVYLDGTVKTLSTMKS